MRGASRWIPSFNSHFCISLCSWFHPNCQDQPSKSAGKSPLSHIWLFANKDCVPLSREWFLCHLCCSGSSEEAVELLSLSDRAGVASLSCTFQAGQPPALLPVLCTALIAPSRMSSSMPSLPSVTPSQALPFPYDESEQDSGKGSSQLELNRTSESWVREAGIAPRPFFSLFAEGARDAVLKPLTAPSHCCGIKREPSSLEEGKCLSLGKTRQRCFSVWSRYEK